MEYGSMISREYSTHLHLTISTEFGIHTCITLQYIALHDITLYYTIYIPKNVLPHSHMFLRFTSDFDAVSGQR